MSVYKDKKRGTYYVSYSVKDYETGKFRHVTKRGFLTQKEAKQWERENYGTVQVRNKERTFKEVSLLWESACQASLEVQQKHKQAFEKRFAAFQDRAIESITKADLIQWRMDLAEMEYGTRTKNSTISYVKGVFKFANDMYGTPDNAKMLKSLKMSDDETMKEMEVWTPAEFQRFLSVVDDPVYKCYFEFLFWTGCRRGEALALQKNDVSDGFATIRYSQRNRNKGLKPTKTKQVRRIQLDDQLWRDICPLLAEPGPYVFGGEKALTPNALNRYFNQKIDEAGVKRIRIHDLRHSHATWLINSGVNIVAVSKRLGHSNIEQTLKTYTHLLQQTDIQMMSTINSFRSPLGTNCETKMNSNPENSPGENSHKSAYNVGVGQNRCGSNTPETDSPHLL